MAETGKKVEVRYGAFACTIEGYDNPAEQLELILGKMQRMIAETPQFSQVASGSEAEDIQEALQRSDDETPSPGIVIIRDSNNQDADSPEDFDAQVADADEVSNTEFDEHETTRIADIEDDADENTDEATVTISAEIAQAEADAVELTDDESAPRAGTFLGAGALATGAAAIAAFASKDDTETVPGDTEVVEDDDTEQMEAPADISESVSLEELGQEPDTDEASEADLEAEAETSTDVLTEPETTSATSAEGPDEEDEAQKSDPLPSAEQDAIANVVTDAETETDAAVNIFAEPAAATGATVQAESDDAPTDQTDSTGEAEPEVADRPDAGARQNIPAASDSVTDTFENIFANPPQETQVAHATPEASTAESDTETKALNIFADPTLQAVVTDAVNIFADPEPEVATEVAETPATILAEPKPQIPDVPKPAAPQVRKLSISTTVGETINIFAAPMADKATDANDIVSSTVSGSAEIWDAATEELERAEPEAVLQTLDNLGERVSQIVDQPVDQPSPETPPIPDFAEPTPQPIPRDSSEADPAQQTSSRFQALLRGQRHGPAMGAPGEPEDTTVQKPETVEEIAPGIRSAHDLANLAGSESVADLLAASAAWLALAEGKQRFSRRDVMDVFEKIPGDHPRTLEARIKGYGKLVRSGMLVLVDDGIFAMAQSERQRFQTMLDR